MFNPATLFMYVPVPSQEPVIQWFWSFVDSFLIGNHTTSSCFILPTYFWDIICFSFYNFRSLDLNIGMVINYDQRFPNSSGQYKYLYIDIYSFKKDWFTEYENIPYHYLKLHFLFLDCVIILMFTFIVL